MSRLEDEHAPSPTPDRSGTNKPSPTPGSPMLESMGGTAGFVYSTVPVVMFVIALALLSTKAAVIAAIATGVVLTVTRLVRGERLLAASGSLTGVLIAAGIVALTGSAKDFFLLGIWVAFAGFLATFSSVLLRRPLTGVAWNLLHKNTYTWREDRAVLRAHDIATLAAALVLGSRFAVKQWLYVHDATGWLAFAKIAMGTPLTVVAALVVAWAFRTSSKRLVNGPADQSASQQEAALPPRQDASR
uniref:Integral membrane alanine and leucine rich protein n=3 Tax=Streptomyces TaxID=1883 RepID=A0A8D4BJF2_STRFA